jgi:hypothetical protein
MDDIHCEMYSFVLAGSPIEQKSKSSEDHPNEPHPKKHKSDTTDLSDDNVPDIIKDVSTESELSGHYKTKSYCIITNV